ncbi:hypothetical protein SISNIDRAFT_546080 [Sistotremastrum niveocremeum HHB9708]|uniref:Ribosome biogenesis protein NSA1 n=2 Tax=Sistotremastraceae TaxID=3402574 RepID=A0A165AMJ5_9AGAM|nr:hypothetical protein SISNIDRAFT_546080 [Sistotremastrum niveocremeum HHB9708]KZT42112.1 hypothetical protein SISSUDRAFT_1126034 [Sistotremastrum suecicum HHB10207 ss-3]
MPTFYAGDELGQTKRIRWTSPDQSLVETIFEREGAKSAMQVMDLRSGMLLTGFADGNASLFSLQDSESGKPTLIQEWKESRLRSQHRYIRATINEKGAYTCTSSGHVRFVPLAKNIGETEETIPSQVTSIPTRLCDFRLSPSGNSFAYGGEEVDLSVWDVDTAFTARGSPAETTVAGQKRKSKSSDLLPGELWRAKNVPNDFLNLRQPVHITSLLYLRETTSGSNHLATGTYSGSVRSYDTRAGKRPVTDWKSLAQKGGIKLMEKGHREHELFIADMGSELAAVDLRNGRKLYTYKGLSGSISAIALTSSRLLASTSLDRLLRIHTTTDLPLKDGGAVEEKGQILDQTFLKSIPTVICWDGEVNSGDDLVSQRRDDGEADDDIWTNMPAIEEGSDLETTGKHSKRRKASHVPGSDQ